MPVTVGILLFPQVEVLDFAGPYEVFSVASRVAVSRGLSHHPPFRVITIASAPGLVEARHGLKVLPDHSFDDAPDIDILIIPGGIVSQPINDEATLAWVGNTAAAAALTASVCTGAFLLARLGLLDGRTATTHWEDIAELRSQYPELTVVENVPFIDHGTVATSGGISAGIGLSLHLVQRIAGNDLAMLTARQMEYDWRPGNT